MRTVTDSTPATTTADLDGMTRAGLLDFAEMRGIVVEAGWNKGEIIKAIKVAMEAATVPPGVPKTEEVPTITNVIASLNALLDQHQHLPPPAITTWSCNAPSDTVLRWMIEKGLPADLFQDGNSLVTW